MNIAINGFGRIGRAAFKILLERKEQGEDIEIKAVNDLTSPDNLAYLLKRDTVYGTYQKEVGFKEDSITVDGNDYKVFAEKEPENLPWKDLDIDVVIESTGFFTSSELASKHLTAGAKRVLLSAPAKDDGFTTVVLGAPENNLQNNLISNASCTTNCITPVLRVLQDSFGVEKSLMTTVHAYTATQGLVDGPDKKDFRRGRAGATNIVPSSTGAAIATTKVITTLENKFDGIALRIPVICGSLSDITALVSRDVTVEEVNNAFKEAQNKDYLKGILQYSEEEIVSSDIIGTNYSSIVDGTMTRVVGGNLVKVMAWYDNEWGYTNRLVDMAILMSKSL